MSVLRKIGSFFGKTIKKVGEVVGAVSKPVSAIAKPLMPLLAANPYGRAAIAGLTVADTVANLAKSGGASLMHATSTQGTSAPPPV